MSERGNRKIPVTEREFLWVQDDDKGEVVLHVGPTMVSPTAADRIVIDDGAGGFREDRSGRPQRMVEIGDNQYGVLSNPLVENDEGPNGRFKNGRNESRPLQNGTRKMIPGPCSFWLRPGQRCEVRDAHDLGSNQYLVVKVYGEVDKEAPYYDITQLSASIRTVTDETEDPGLERAQAKAGALSRGQLIVIRGLDTQFYIPPTGVDIVPDTSIDTSGAALGSGDALKLLRQVEKKADLESKDAEMLRNVILEAEVNVQQMASEQAVFEDDEDELFDAPPPSRGQRRGRKQKKMKSAPPLPPQAQQRMAPPPPPPPMPAQAGGGAPGLGNLQTQLAEVPSLREAIQREARQARLVRNAVVLGEKEYCVIIDADGKRQIKVGPARVFPGPYDQFQVEGSRDRVYEAYELLPQRALWLRVIAPLSKEQMGRRLPHGIALENERYEPGDEVLLTGVNTFFFPFNEIEVLSPENGQPVVGNDHSKVFIEAIGIDQKSGIYVSDLATGEVRLVRGKCSYLVDPRKEVHIPRRVPADDWNKWISYGEPHKIATEPTDTWWALSIVVPPNTACLATSANSQRVIEGPCVTLLEFEERLVPLSLSTRVPKSDDHPLNTCFLRVVGNRVSDEIVVETVDFVEIAVRVSYGVTFQREKKKLWFGTENYVQVMCEHLRSLVRNTCRTHTLLDIWPKLPTLIRDSILGEKGEHGTRVGRIFEEYGFVVSEVEVLSSSIRDGNIGQLMREMQNESVALQIGDRQNAEAFESARKRSELDVKQHELQTGSEKRKAELAQLINQLRHEVDVAALRSEEELAQERQSLEARRQLAEVESANEREDAALTARLGWLSRETETKVGADRLTHEEELAFRKAITELEVARAKAVSDAKVAEHSAVQDGLIEALTGLGDKVLLSEVAQNMNLISLFQGKDVGSILGDVLGGTRAMETIQKMVQKHGKKKPEA